MRTHLAPTDVLPTSSTLTAKLAAAAIAGLALLPAGAAASTYCVPTLAACPGSGTAKATFEAALDAADDAADADAIHLAAGTYTAPSTGGFTYDLTTGPVTVIGAGSTGAGRTVITTPVGSSRVLRLLGGPGSRVARVAVVVADDAASGTPGQLEVQGTALEEVSVAVAPAQTQPFIGVRMKSGSTMEDSSVDVPDRRAVFVSGPGVSLVRSRISGGTGLESNAGAVSTVAERLRITATWGVATWGSALRITGSTVRLLDGGCGLCAYDQPGSDGEIEADGVTVTGPDPGAIAAGAFASFVDRAVRVEVRNSIVAGMKGRHAGSSSTGTASVEFAYSRFDPVTDSTSGSGAKSLVPASGTLGATNISAAPLFAGKADFRLAPDSPAIDAGDPATASGFDLDDRSWLEDGDANCSVRRDMGAYERQEAPGCAPPTPPASDVEVPIDASTPGGSSADGPVAPVPPTGPAGPKTSAPADRSAPRIGGLRVRLGIVRFVLDEPARVCVEVATPRRPSKPICRAAAAGAHRIRLARRASRVRHTVRLTAVDAAGNRRVSRRITVRPTQTRS